MSSASSQKFIGRNRPPRVQIEYDVETGNGTVKKEIPFVMGVMADLTGKWDEPDDVPAEHKTARGGLDTRKFLEIDIDNFDQRLKAMKPRAAFVVPDTLSGKQGQNLSVDLTFESMDDFSPAAVARKVEPLRQLLEARTQLKNLLAYMDGKSKAEQTLAAIIADPAVAQALASMPKAENQPEQKKE